ncbi:MAG: carbohydrate ABC transporter permease [Clostridia bacterium]|nr:carbohydrate ABC transporter permease [Clostridia bacterium]
MRFNSALEKTQVMRKHTARAGFVLVRTVLCIGFAYTILYPLIMMISRAFMAAEDLYDNSVVWIPKTFTLDTIRAMLKSLNYGEGLWNSFWISLIVTVLQLVSCMMAGYGFARFKFPGRSLLFGGVIFSLLVPPQLIILPEYLNFRAFDIFGIFELITGNAINMLNSSLPIFILAATANGIKCGLYIYIFRQTFINMPVETEEAATVDGAGTIRTFVTIMVPGAMNAAITVALFSFVWQWNDLFFSEIYLKQQTLSMSYGGISLETATSINPNFANYNFYNTTIQAAFKGTAVLLILLPLILIFLVLQKYFVDSVENSGIVG